MGRPFGRAIGQLGPRLLNRLAPHQRLLGPARRVGRVIEETLVDRFSFDSPVSEGLVRFTGDIILATRFEAMAAFIPSLGVHDEVETQRAVDAGARVIGVNARNLKTLEVHPDTFSRLAPLVPPGVVTVAESGIAGMAVGMALGGARPVIEMQFDAFAYPAFEQIASHVAKMRNRTKGATPMPITLRIPYGGGIGGVEHHCDSSESYYAHTPGLKVYTPASVKDAYMMLRSAIRLDDPVVFM